MPEYTRRPETYDEHFARAWEYGHNELRMASWLLARFAHAYADIAEEENLSLGVFYAMWDQGEFEPDSLNHWHHKSWFSETEKRVA